MESTSKKEGLPNCPACDKPMYSVGKDHYHCDCGRCLWEGFELTYRREYNA